MTRSDLAAVMDVQSKLDRGEEVLDADYRRAVRSIADLALKHEADPNAPGPSPALLDEIGSLMEGAGMSLADRRERRAEEEREAGLAQSYSAAFEAAKESGFQDEGDRRAFTQASEARPRFQSAVDEGYPHDSSFWAGLGGDEYAAAIDYVGAASMSKAINRQVMGLPVPQLPGSASISGADIDIARSAEALSRAIDQHPKLPEGTQVFRGVHGEFADDLIARASVGSTLTMSGLQSTSTERKIAEEFAGKREGPGVVLDIKTRRGMPTMVASNFTDEREVLLGHNWSYRVTGVEGNVISLEVLS